MNKYIRSVITLVLTAIVFRAATNAPEWAVWAVSWLAADITFATYQIREFLEEE